MARLVSFNTTSHCQINCPRPKSDGRECNVTGSFEHVKTCNKWIDCMKCRDKIQLKVSPKVQAKTWYARISALLIMISIILLALLSDLFINCANFWARVYHTGRSHPFSAKCWYAHQHSCPKAFLVRLQCYSEVMQLTRKHAFPVIEIWEKWDSHLVRIKE